MRRHLTQVMRLESETLRNLFGIACDFFEIVLAFSCDAMANFAYFVYESRIRHRKPPFLCFQ